VPGAPTAEKQLLMWVEGTSVCPNQDHECCPDFSCCRPKLRWPRRKREQFMAASEQERERMLLGSLSALTQEAGLRAHVAGAPIPVAKRVHPQKRGKLS
jgi:hypothetical protein